MKFKTFVINMKRSPERLAFMSDQLNRLGIPFSVQEGIDGNTYDFGALYDDALARKKNGVPLTAGEKGCLLSHRLIWEKIIAEDLDYALIFEDDIELAANFKGALDHELARRESGKTHWEYLSFNYPTPGFKFIRLWLFLLSEKFSRDQSWTLRAKIPLYAAKFIGIVLLSCWEQLRSVLYRNIHRFGAPARFWRPVYLAGCYVLTKSGAEKLLSVSKLLVYPADRIQNIARREKKLRIFWYVPLLAKQRRDKFKSILYDNKNYVFEKYD